MTIENYYIFIALKYKELQTIIAMIIESKVMELFCMTNDFCKFFDIILLLKKQTIIETVNEQT